MNTAIKLMVITFLLSGCQAIAGSCDANDSVPYSKDEVGESHCNDKCCEFVVYKAAEACHEMWCYSDCNWKKKHEYCY